MNHSSENRSRTERFVVASGAALLALGASACSGGEANYVGESKLVVPQSKTTINVGSSLRTKPFRGKDIESATRCAEVTQSIPFPMSGAVINTFRDRVNGPYYGIPLNNFPDYIQEDCANETGMAWVAQTNIIVSDQVLGYPTPPTDIVAG